jgi:hypothetical protein
MTTQARISRGPSAAKRRALLRSAAARPRRLRASRVSRRLPTALKFAAGIVIAVALFLALNWAYQVVRKPSELLFPISGQLSKAPAETWRQYGSIFTENSTRVITPDLLAALAQVEAAGNPVARTYWRWAWTLHPLQMYRPASTAVGMYQITDGTFAEARHYCIRQHIVVEESGWNSGSSCWFNGLYMRVLPAHAVELTSAYLDRDVAYILKRRRIIAASLTHRQELAAVIHLCGAGAGDSYAARGFQLHDGQRCGDHTVRVYLTRVKAMQRVFQRLALQATS